MGKGTGVIYFMSAIVVIGHTLARRNWPVFDILKSDGNSGYRSTACYYHWQRRTFSKADGHVIDGEVVIAHHFKAKRHKQPLSSCSIHLSAITVPLIGQQMIEVMVVDDDAAATASTQPAAVSLHVIHGTCRMLHITGRALWTNDNTASQYTVLHSAAFYHYPHNATLAKN